MPRHRYREQAPSHKRMPSKCGRGLAPDEAMTVNAFPQADRDAVYRAIAERRDMRHFIGGDVDP